MLPALLFAAGAAASPAAGPAPCRLLFPVAPDAAAARRIALVVTASRPHPPRRRYVLKVRPDEDDAGKWIAFQDLPPPPRPFPKNAIYLQAGGGGLGMRIDRCTGEVSDLFYQR